MFQLQITSKAPGFKSKVPGGNVPTLFSVRETSGTDSINKVHCQPALDRMVAGTLQHSEGRTVYV